MMDNDVYAIRVCAECGRDLKVLHRADDPVRIVRLECPRGHISGKFRIGMQIDADGIDTRQPDNCWSCNEVIVDQNRAVEHDEGYTTHRGECTDDYNEQREWIDDRPALN